MAQVLPRLRTWPLISFLLSRSPEGQRECPLCPSFDVGASPHAATGNSAERRRKVLAHGVTLRRWHRDSEHLGDVRGADEILGRHEGGPYADEWTGVGCGP